MSDVRVSPDPVRPLFGAEFRTCTRGTVQGRSLDPMRDPG